MGAARRPFSTPLLRLHLQAVLTIRTRRLARVLEHDATDTKTQSNGYGETSWGGKGGKLPRVMHRDQGKPLSSQKGVSSSLRIGPSGPHLSPPPPPLPPHSSLLFPCAWRRQSLPPLLRSALPLAPPRASSLRARASPFRDAQIACRVAFRGARNSHLASTIGEMTERADDGASGVGAPGRPAETDLPAPEGSSPPRAPGASRALPVPEDCKRCLGLLYYSSTLLEERKEPVCRNVGRREPRKRARRAKRQTATGSDAVVPFVTRAEGGELSREEREGWGWSSCAFISAEFSPRVGFARLVFLPCPFFLALVFFPLQVCVGLRRSVDPARARTRGGPAEARPSGEFRYVCWGCADYDAAGLHRSAGRPPAPGDAPLPRCIGVEAVAAARTRVEGVRPAVGEIGREGTGDRVAGRPGLGEPGARGQSPGGNSESEARRFLERFQAHAARIAARMVYNVALIGEYAQKGVENVLGKGGSDKK